VFPQNLVDAVEHGSPLARQFRTQRRQLSIVGFLRSRRLDAPQAKGMLPLEELLPMDPEQVAQLAGIAAIGLLLGPLRRLREHGFATTVLLEHRQQPIVHAADLQDRQKAALRPGLLGKIGKEGTNLLPLCTHLPLENHGPVFAAQIHRQLPLVLVDTEV
jgi:hypothetical protein